MTLRDQAQMCIAICKGTMYEDSREHYFAAKLLQTLDAIDSIRDSDPDAYRAIMREMGDGR